MEASPIAREKASVIVQRLRAEEDRRKQSIEASEHIGKSFRAFVPLAWEHIEPSRPFISNAWHIDAICDHMQAVADGHIRNLIINVPPGSAKSNLVSVMFPAWKWIRDPGWRSTFASYESGLATRDSVRCRDLLKSIWYRETFTPQWNMAVDQDEKTYYVNTAKGFRVATSVGGRGTGWRSNFIGVDDPQSADAQFSDADLDFCVKWWENVMYNRLINLQTDARVIIMQRVSERDLSGHLLRQGGYEHLCYDKETEILTKNGWIRFPELQPNVEVLGVDPSTMIAKWETPTNHIAYHYDGEMVHLKSAVADLMVTPEHRMIYFDHNDVGASWSSARICRADSLPTTCEIPQAAHWQSEEEAVSFAGKSWPTNVFASFMGWYLSEGCASVKTCATRIVQKEGDTAEEIGRVLSRIPFAKIHRQKRRNGMVCWVIGSKQLAEALAPLGKAINKTIPREVLDLPEPALRLFILAYSAGDGGPAGRNGNGLMMSSRSKAIVDGLQECCVKAGWASSVHFRKTPARAFNGYMMAPGFQWTLYIRTSKRSDKSRKWYATIRPSNIRRVQYSDKVYCVSVPSTAVVVRRNGVVSVSGNCIPMEYDPSRSKVTTLSPGVEWRDPRTKAGELMFEPIFSREMVDRDLKPKPVWAGQYQQQPNVEGGGILKAHKWRYWQPPTANLPNVRVKLPNGDIEERAAVPLPTQFDFQLMSWDCTFKDLKTSDFVCGQVHAVRGADRFILQQVMRRMGIVETMAAIREMAGNNPSVHLKLVEDKANGTAVVEMLQREISGLVLVEPKGGKVARAQAAAPEQESGNWYLPHPMIAPWVGNPENPSDGGFLASTTAFPYGANDDDVDSWSQGACRIQAENVGGAFHVSDRDIRCDPFGVGEKWPRVYGLSLNWREVGAVWIARRPETDQHYLYAEYFAPVSDPAMHAAEIRKQGDWIVGVSHPTEPGRDERSGYALLDKYRKLGLKLESCKDNEAAEVADLQEGLNGGKLKVFGSLTRFFDQFLMCRPDEKTGKLPQYNSAVIRAMCVAWKHRDKMRAPLEPEKARSSYQTGGPVNGWMKA